MNKTNEQSTGSSKPSFQSQSLGPNKVASTEAPATTPDVKPEIEVLIPEVVHQVTARTLLEKQS